MVFVHPLEAAMCDRSYGYVSWYDKVIYLGKAIDSFHVQSQSSIVAAGIDAGSGDDEVYLHAPSVLILKFEGISFMISRPHLWNGGWREAT
jgi:hypothetical protein